MALDRQSIEKKDFPIGRRGYEPEAVDAHLAAIAAEVSELTRTAASGGGSLASAASSQVQAILSAAETTAAQILSDAEQQGQQLREQAEQDGRRLREEAEQEAQQARAALEGEAQRRREEAEQQAQQVRADAEQEAQRLRAQADGDVQHLREEAEHEAQQLRAQGEGEAKRLRDEAEQETQRVRSEAEQQAERLRSEATGDAERLRHEAEGEAQRLRGEAEEDARRIRERAFGDAAATRERARDETRTFVSAASESAAAMIARVESMEHELGGTLGSLRAGASELASQLDALRSNLSVSLESADSEPSWEAQEVVAHEQQLDEQAAVEPEPESELEAAADEPEPEPVAFEPLLPDQPDAAVPATPWVSTAADAPAPESNGGTPAEPEPMVSVAPPEAGETSTDPSMPLSPVSRPPLVSEPEPVQHLHTVDGQVVDPALAEGALRFERAARPASAGAPAPRDPDAEGARLIALNMALNGSSREDVDRYLTENFNLSDRAGLLAEVFTSVEG